MARKAVLRILPVALRGKAGFPEKPSSHFRTNGECRREHLDRDLSLEAHIAGEKFHAHAPAPDLPLDGEVSGECCLQLEEFR